MDEAYDQTARKLVKVWHVVSNYQIYRDHKYFCPECEGRVYLRRCYDKSDHFYHQERDPSCSRCSRTSNGGGVYRGTRFDLGGYGKTFKIASFAYFHDFSERTCENAEKLLNIPPNKPDFSLNSSVGLVFENDLKFIKDYNSILRSGIIPISIFHKYAFDSWKRTKIHDSTSEGMASAYKEMFLYEHVPNWIDMDINELLNSEQEAWEKFSNKKVYSCARDAWLSGFKDITTNLYNDEYMFFRPDNRGIIRLSKKEYISLRCFCQILYLYFPNTDIFDVKLFTFKFRKNESRTHLVSEIKQIPIESYNQFLKIMIQMQKYYRFFGYYVKSF